MSKQDKLNDKENSLDYNLEDFDDDIVIPKPRDDIEAKKASVSEYGDDFDFQTGEHDEKFSYSLDDDRDEAYYSKNSVPPGRRAHVKSRKRVKKIKNAAIILAIIATFCLAVLVVIIFTQCENRKSSEILSTTPSTIDFDDELITQPFTEAVYEKVTEAVNSFVEVETTSYIEPTTAYQEEYTQYPSQAVEPNAPDDNTNPSSSQSSYNNNEDDDWDFDD